MDRKLLLFDVDGTLISYDGIIPSSMVEALKEAKDLGHYVFVVTGRTRNRATVGDIEVSGMICGNGAYVECEGNVLQDKKLSLEDKKYLSLYLGILNTENGISKQLKEPGFRVYKRIKYKIRMM